jgi:hypothetical protein
LCFLSGTERRHGLTPTPDKEELFILSFPRQVIRENCGGRTGRSAALTDFTTADALYVNFKLQFAR